MAKEPVGFIGVTGFAGSGKTTAVEHLSKLTSGRIIYFGKAVLDELKAKQLPRTRDNERQVRIDLRHERGPAVLAMPHLDELSECYAKAIPVFVDAIFTQAEFDLLASRVPSGSAHLLAIEASFADRRERLETRPERPFSAEELRKRDSYELKDLRTDCVIAAAKYRIRNEGSLDEFLLEVSGLRELLHL